MKSLRILWRSLSLIIFVVSLQILQDLCRSAKILQRFSLGPTCMLLKKEMKYCIVIVKCYTDPQFGHQILLSCYYHNVWKSKKVRDKKNGWKDKTYVRGTQRQFSEGICSKDDLRSRIFGTLFVKFLACLPLLGFLNI